MFGNAILAVASTVRPAVIMSQGLKKDKSNQPLRTALFTGRTGRTINMAGEGPVQELMDLVGRRTCGCPDLFIIVPEPHFYDRPGLLLIKNAEAPRQVSQRNDGIGAYAGNNMAGKANAGFDCKGGFPGKQGRRDRDQEQLIGIVADDRSFEVGRSYGVEVLESGHSGPII